MKLLLEFLFLTSSLVFAFAEEKPKWEVQDQVDPIDDTHFVVLKMGANTEAGLDSDVVLYVRHMNGEDEVFLGMDRFAKEASVTVRFDAQQAYKESVGYSDDGNYLFFRDPMDIIEKLLNSKKLAVRVELEDNQKITSTFTIGDFAAQVKKINTSVDWIKPWKTTNGEKNISLSNMALRAKSKEILDILSRLGEVSNHSIHIGALFISIVPNKEYQDRDKFLEKLRELCKRLPVEIWIPKVGGQIRIEVKAVAMTDEERAFIQETGALTNPDTTYYISDGEIEFDPWAGFVENASGLDQK